MRPVSECRTSSRGTADNLRQKIKEAQYPFRELMSYLGPEPWSEGLTNGPLAQCKVMHFLFPITCPFISGLLKSVILSSLESHFCCRSSGPALVKRHLGKTRLCQPLRLNCYIQLVTYLCFNQKQ